MDSEGVSMILLLDVKMANGVLEHKVLSEIDQATVDHLNSLFEFTSAYMSSKIAKEIVYRNGERFKALMKPENLSGYQRHMDDVILEANRHVYNYAASIKSFIDIDNTQGFLN